jgi:hypothetical protein
MFESAGNHASLLIKAFVLAAVVGIIVAGFGVPAPITPASAQDAIPELAYGQVTVRIGNDTDPVLKPWAAQQMRESNAEVLSGKRAEGFMAQSRSRPACESARPDQAPSQASIPW